MNKATITWFKAAGVRALRTVAQTIIGSVSVGLAINEVNWVTVLSVSAVAGILSICTSVVTTLPELPEE